MAALAGGRSLVLIQQASVVYRRGIGALLGPSWEIGSALETPWSCQQIRTKARGNEYQPSNIKRKHKHGWIKRIRTASGIEVILRRMLKGRKSLTH
ncbi:large ribosomal subunit protein bL34m [Anolis carolinensis]|uniref:large ribosomal subunit protein bL34m n=1 Tax=Anolis carolinensis TaxID=28377 RepID=UPI002F2B181D